MSRLLLCCLLTAPLIQAATPVFQASFEKSGQNWTAISGAATSDSTVLRGDHKSLRLEPTQTGSAPVVRFAPVALTIGKRYELSGWVRTEDLAVKDLDRSPIAVGAALTMASMPWDVHSASVGGTQPWTRAVFEIRCQPRAGCDHAHRRQRGRHARQSLV